MSTPTTDRAYKRGEKAPGDLEAVRYTVYPADSSLGDGVPPSAIVLWVGLAENGSVNIDAGRERLESEGWEVTDWGAA